MKEIVERLQEQRKVSLAKEVLESKGYRVERLKEGNSVRKLTETTYRDLYISLDSNSKPLPETVIDELLDVSEGLTVNPLSEELAIPWDADINVEDGELIIDGYVAPGGSLSGKAIAKISLNNVRRVVEVIIVSCTDKDRIKELLDPYGWAVS